MTVMPRNSFGGKMETCPGTQLTIRCWSSIWGDICLLCKFCPQESSERFWERLRCSYCGHCEPQLYVDDCLKSVVTVSEASKLAKQLVQLLVKGGFHLTKWISNSREVLEEIPSSERAPSISSLDLEDLPIDRTLDTQWDVEADTLSFRAKEKPVPDIRRGILSFTSSLYDPLGFSAPLILPAKVLLQELCRLDFGWDETVPNETLVKWRVWLHDLPNLKLVSWLRCLKPKDFGVLHSIQLHHFSDASEVGYKAASYLRLLNDQEELIVD